MKKHMMQYKIIFMMISFFAGFTYSQSIDETLSNLSTDAVTKYSQPVISAFGSNMTSGWFSGLPDPYLLGFHVNVRFVGVGSLFANDSRRFSTTGQFRFTSEQADEILNESGIDPSEYPNYNEIKNDLLGQVWEVNIEGPTITGSADENVMVEFPGGEIDGYNIQPYSVALTEARGYLNNSSFLATPAIQLDLSGFAGTSVSLRYFTGVDISSLGDIDVFGAGFSHNLNFWFRDDPLPLDIGVGFYFQKFDVGNNFTNTATQTGVYISKKVGAIISFIPYVGLTYETSNSKLDYQYRFDTPAGEQTNTILVDFKGDNAIGLTLGSTIKFPVLSLNFDYKIANSQTGTIGIGFGF